MLGDVLASPQLDERRSWSTAPRRISWHTDTVILRAICLGLLRLLRAPLTGDTGNKACWSSRPRRCPTIGR
jgi:hypothetical protein